LIKREKAPTKLETTSAQRAKALEGREQKGKGKDGPARAKKASKKRPVPRS